jgi:hypothetical protein
MNGGLLTVSTNKNRCVDLFQTTAYFLRRRQEELLVADVWTCFKRLRTFSREHPPRQPSQELPPCTYRTLARSTARTLT